MIASGSRDTRYRSKGRRPAKMPAFEVRLSVDQIHMIAIWRHGSRYVLPTVASQER